MMCSHYTINYCEDLAVKEYISNSSKETEQIAYEFAKTLRSGDVVAFVGGLGAGKTAFVRGVGAALSVRDEISSPTFAIVHVYRGETTLVHFDMYRIDSVEDLYSCGYFDYLEDDVITVIEWSENIWNVLPDNCIYIKIEVLNDNERKIIISQRGQKL